MRVVGMRGESVCGLGGRRSVFRIRRLGFAGGGEEGG